ncbi:hypothetical protein CEE37_03010 [candidate division LCP-89 bacterium B3_LCP]|uniref:Glycosyl transferase family 1 n=1 Tax=candidate division LCP-89 bacterium B3_LCP TaxID=2012998 RepID=A0A532V326_UNCL8|nr:MAG: hypothetical protein CEE37_03010 [candidate division LCP-89 bacterium B3_LCP]
MRILIVSHLWPRESWSNYGIFVSDQAAALTEHVDVTVAVPIDLTVRRSEISVLSVISGMDKYRKRTKPELISYPEIKLVEVPFKAALLRQKFTEKTIGNLSEALSSVSLGKFDLVHAHTIYPDGLACAQWLEEQKTPLVITAHGTDVHSISEGVLKLLDPLLHRADALVPVSNFLGDQLIKFGADKSQVRVIPNGFVAQQFSDVDDSHRDPRKIVLLGNLRPVKRVDILIRALQYCSEDIHLEIGGDGPSKKELENLVKKLDLQDRVKFLGLVPRKDVPSFFAQASLMCLVSSREGWPTVIFEALACGTPVLATSVGGVPEALSHAGLGQLVPPDINPEALAEEIESSLDFNWNRQFIRDYAGRFSWAEIAKQLMTLYRDILPDCNPSVPDELHLRS